MTEEYLDVSLRDRVQRRYGISDREGDLLSRVEIFELEEAMGETIMSEIQKHVGDGNARVTVGAELGVNDYGTKASAFCNVSVTCNNHMDDVAAIHDIVHPYVKSRVEQDLIEMETILKRHLKPEEGQAETVPSKVVEPPKRTGPSFKR